MDPSRSGSGRGLFVPGRKCTSFLLEHDCFVMCSILDSPGIKSPAHLQLNSVVIWSPLLVTTCDSARGCTGSRLAMQISTSFPIREAPGSRSAVNPPLECSTGVAWAIIRSVCAHGVGFRVRCGTPSVPSQRCRLHAQSIVSGRPRTNLVDPASSHMLVSKVKPCMSKYKLLYSETANGSLKQLLSPWQSSNLGYLW